MEIVIKSVAGRVLYTVDAESVRAALEKATGSGANLRAVLDAAPNEVAGLAAAVREGRVNGSAYEGACACLLGTIANVRGCKYTELAIRPDSDRPAERFFMRISEGHTPSNSVDAALALAWITEWQADRAREVSP